MAGTDAYDVYTGPGTELAVVLAVYGVVEDIAYVFPDEAKGADELVSAVQRGFVVYAYAGDDEVCAGLVECGEADAVGVQVLVTCVLHVVLVVGIVDDTLQVAFVVAYLESVLIVLVWLLHSVAVFVPAKLMLYCKNLSLDGGLMNILSYFCVLELITGQWLKFIIGIV